MNTTRHARTAAIVLSALLSAGMVLAQASDASQAPSADAAQAAPAQQGHHNFDPNGQAAHLSKQLGLSEDQAAQIKPILADRFQQMQTLRADTSLSQQDRHTKIRALMQDSNSKIEAVLSDTQKQQFEKIQAERRSHQHNRQTQGATQPQA